MKPALSKYSNTLNVNVALNYWELLHPHNKLTQGVVSETCCVVSAFVWTEMSDYTETNLIFYEAEQ